MNDMSGTEAESYVLKTAFFSVTPPNLSSICESAADRVSLRTCTHARARALHTLVAP